MQPEVHKGRGGVFDRREALIERLRLKQPFDQSLRHRRPAFVVEREAAQHLRPLQPALVDL